MKTYYETKAIEVTSKGCKYLDDNTLFLADTITDEIEVENTLTRKPFRAIAFLIIAVFLFSEAEASRSFFSPESAYIIGGGFIIASLICLFIKQIRVRFFMTDGKSASMRFGTDKEANKFIKALKQMKEESNSL